MEREPHRLVTGELGDRVPEEQELIVWLVQTALRTGCRRTLLDG